jgi:transcription initiation factor TFIID subunit 1
VGQLARLGLGRILEELVAESRKEEIEENGEGDEDDYAQKSPSAVDFSDITELAEVEESHGGDEAEPNYDADDEGLGSDHRLMPPPPPPHHSASNKRLDTPLAAMLPSKYANIDVTQLFPDFRVDKVHKQSFTFSFRMIFVKKGGSLGLFICLFSR